MCGIAGMFRRLGGVTTEDVCAVERAVLAQRHRGPDDSGLYHDDRAVLGHRRLSIIDLSPLGHQPMCNEDETVWVTYNGEIYNFAELRAELCSRGHRFRSNTDSEVLVHGYEEWGVDGLPGRLAGMFAFAVYDKRSGDCHLVRDRFGIKPLYYHLSASLDLLVWASEVKALTRSGLVPACRDAEATAGFLLFGSVPSPLTFTSNVRCLLPGHCLTLTRDGLSVRKYWDLGFSGDGEFGDQLEQPLQTLLQDAVRSHLVSDVPVGIFLSGGVDSAGLVALASRSAAQLTTLTVVFDEDDFSEAAPARRVAERFRTDHRQVRVTSHDFVSVIPELLAAMDQPTNDGVNTYFVSRAARQAGLTVVLSGLGGDEVFWGYKYYRWLVKFGAALRGFSSLPSGLRKVLLRTASACGRSLSSDRWARLSFLENRMSDGGLYAAMRGFFAPEQVCRLLGLSSSEVTEVAERHLSVYPEKPSMFASAGTFGYLEMKRYMHDQLLRDTDVFSMAHSIEVRVPYLDHRVVECAAKAVSQAKLADGTNKPLLVNAVGEPLVREAAAAGKRGFTFPFQKWIHENSDSLEGMALESGLLEEAGVRNCWKHFREGHVHWSRAWALTILGAES